MTPSTDAPWYPAPVATTTAEIEVKRSRFIGHVIPVRSERDARTALDGLRRRHHAARHHCWALIIGPGDDLVRFGDDGEPAGTAGAPILDTLRGHGLGDVVAVVVRYFGGTLLGAGGLVRAYGDAVSAALDGAALIRRTRFELFLLPVDHAVAGRVEAELRNRGVSVRGVEYLDRAILTVAVAPGGVHDLEATVAGVTSGAGDLAAAGTEWVDLH